MKTNSLRQRLKVTADAGQFIMKELDELVRAVSVMKRELNHGTYSPETLKKNFDAMDWHLQAAKTHAGIKGKR